MRLAALLVRMLCVLALIGSSLSIRAGEAVCVMQDRVVPMATCGMPCCVHPKASGAYCTSSRPSTELTCCREGGERILSPRSSARLDKAACRCEVRPNAALRPLPGSVTERSTAVVLGQTALSGAPAILAITPPPVPEPGIVGTDSGPPPEPLPRDSSGLSPPARPVSSEA